MATATKRIIKKLLRTLSGVLLTFFIVVLVDLQLRTRHSLTPFAAGPGERSSQAVNSLSKDRNVLSKSSDRGQSDNIHQDGSRRKNKDREFSPAPWPRLQPQDVFIAVKTTGRFHRTRLDLLLETWISITKEHVSVCLNGITLCSAPLTYLSRL